MNFSGADIIAALKEDYAGGTLNAVEGAGALPAAWDQVKVTRTAFVMPPGELAHDNDAGTGVTRQRVVVDFQVILVFTRIGAAGADQSAAMDAAREGVKNALVGKILADMDDPIYFRSAGVLDVDIGASALAYALTFNTAYTLRRNA